MFDGRKSWITVTGGAIGIGGAGDLFAVVRAGYDGATDQSVVVSDPSRLRAICGATLTVSGVLPHRLDLLCVNSRSGTPIAAICLLNPGPDVPPDRMPRLSQVMMRLLDLHDRLEDYRQIVALSLQLAVYADASGTITAMSDALGALVGLRAGDDLYKRFRELVKSENETALEDAWR